MSPRVSLSLKAAKLVLGNLAGDLHVRRELSAAISAAERKTATKKRLAAPKKAKRQAKRATTKEVRKLVAARAGQFCECGCGMPFGDYAHTQATLDHFWGRSRAESVETCWLLRWDHHEAKTLNKPSRQHWLRLFEAHALEHGYVEQADRCITAGAYDVAKRQAPPPTESDPMLPMGYLAALPDGDA